MTALTARVRELTDSIAEKTAESSRLALELAASLGIQDVWPAAFEGGQSCKLCARETVSTMQDYQRRVARAKKAGRIYEPELKEMYLLRADGVRLDLTSAQYWALKSIPRGK
jgi:hypothetical protein